MDLFKPHYVDVVVPDAVLLPGDAPAAVTVHPNASGAVWYQAQGASLTCDGDGAVVAWHTQAGIGSSATPVKPNEGNLRVAAQGGLTFQSKVNAGLVVADALVEPEAFTIAVRYMSEQGEARSLATVNPKDEGNYLFLAEKEGALIWQDQDDEAALSMPAPKGGGWAIASYSDGQLSLACAAIGGAVGTPLTTRSNTDGVRAALAGSCDLFIGCRSHRKGILKTLGTSTMLDVLVWIDSDCLADPAGLAAALRQCETEGNGA